MKYGGFSPGTPGKALALVHGQGVTPLIRTESMDQITWKVPVTAAISSVTRLSGHHEKPLPQCRSSPLQRVGPLQASIPIWVATDVTKALDDFADRAWQHLR